MAFRKVEKSRSFTIFLKALSKEKYAVDISTDMTVSELKDKAEEKTGIPRQLQRLRYIDECDMEDDASLSFYHLTSNAVIKMCLWPEWRPLIRAVCRGDLQAVLSCGVSARKLSEAGPRVTTRIEPSMADKGSVALFIAAHRGHNQIVQAMMQANIRAFEAQPSDRTPLLMAAKNSRVETVDLLLGRTRCVARSNQYDTVRERTLQSLVALLEKKGACKKLWFAMNQAKLNKVKTESHPSNRLLRQHQMHDSRTPVWMKAKLRRFSTKTMYKASENGDIFFNELLKKARGDIVTDYLKSLNNLPRPAKGFSIKADLKMSTNGRGVGVFAAEFLPAGKRIDTDREHVAFTKEQACAFLEALPNDEQRRWWLEHIYCLDEMMKTDMAELDTMMINHADEPTVVTREDGYDYTTRDVNIGEELTEDYRTYDIVPYYDELCKKYAVDVFNNDWT